MMARSSSLYPNGKHRHYIYIYTYIAHPLMRIHKIILVHNLPSLVSIGHGLRVSYIDHAKPSYVCSWKVKFPVQILDPRQACLYIFRFMTNTRKPSCRCWRKISLNQQSPTKTKQRTDIRCALPHYMSLFHLFDRDSFW